MGFRGREGDRPGRGALPVKCQVSPHCVAFVWHVSLDSQAVAPSLSWGPHPSQHQILSNTPWPLERPAELCFVFSARH